MTSPLKRIEFYCDPKPQTNDALFALMAHENSVRLEVLAGKNEGRFYLFDKPGNTQITVTWYYIESDETNAQRTLSSSIPSLMISASRPNNITASTSAAQENKPDPASQISLDQDALYDIDPCLAKREPGEPMFILLARDSAAAARLDDWCDARAGEILADQRDDNEEEWGHIQSVREKAQAFRAWYEQNRTARAAKPNSQKAARPDSNEMSAVFTNNVQTILDEYGPYIAARQPLRLILSGVDLLPDQILELLSAESSETSVAIKRMIAICELWKRIEASRMITPSILPLGLAGRYGPKGMSSRIVEDTDMPVDPTVE